MKRIFLVVLTLMVFTSAAHAQIDISNMTYSELVSLKDKINLAIWNSNEWQEVTVPPGVYQVGVDLPAGHWTLKCADKWWYTSVSWGEKLSVNEKSIEWYGRYEWFINIYSPTHMFYEVGLGLTEYDINVREGEYVIIENAPCVFSTYAGKPELGFK